MKTCHSCGKTLDSKGKVGRTEECPFCSADFHCCLNCAFFDPQSAKQCREPVAELVRDKAKANFCDYFVFAERRSAGQDGAKEHALRELDALFNKEKTSGA